MCDLRCDTCYVVDSMVNVSSMFSLLREAPWDGAFGGFELGRALPFSLPTAPREEGPRHLAGLLL
jgi:hypothetical protein